MHERLVFFLFLIIIKEKEKKKKTNKTKQENLCYMFLIITCITVISFFKDLFLILVFSFCFSKIFYLKCYQIKIMRNMFFFNI